MKFSIITATYNSENTVLETLNSVAKQSFGEFEHLIIDSKSDDRTLEIAEKNGENIKIYSEKDSGIYDAMNKGINLSTGEIIGILNSDDFFYSNDVLQEVNDVFEKKGADVVYADIVYVDKDNIEKITRIWKAGEFSKWKIWFGWIVPHPAVFVKKSVYEKKGFFDLNFKVSADYDFLLRVIKDKEIKKERLDKVLVKMRTGGKSDSSFLNRLKDWHELCLIFKKNYGIYPFWFFITRPLIKIHQILN
jgi:glycosyltransferase involved in cell wall biosynthesis